jgi:hypothetical protein
MLLRFRTDVNSTTLLLVRRRPLTLVFPSHEYYTKPNCYCDGWRSTFSSVKALRGWEEQPLSFKAVIRLAREDPPFATAGGSLTQIFRLLSVEL